MFITYDNKKNESDILEKTPEAKLKIVLGKGAKNRLIYGDNLSALKSLLDTHAGEVDLINLY